MDKMVLRKEMLEKRNKQDKNNLLLKSLNIVNQIKTDSDYINSNVIALFYPMEYEVNLLKLLDDNKIFCFPKVTKDGLIFIKYEKNQNFVQSKFKVFEPIDGIIIDDKIEYLIAPALLISKELYRIGYGKGYYDKFLSLFRPKHVVGVIYDFQEVKSFKYDDYDQKLDKYFKG